MTIITQHHWQPRHGNETVFIRHKGEYTEVWMPGCDEAIVVSKDHALNIVMTDMASPNPSLKKIEAIRTAQKD